MLNIYMYADTFTHFKIQKLDLYSPGSPLLLLLLPLWPPATRKLLRIKIFIIKGKVEQDEVEAYESIRPASFGA
jgi:hypothetical protein